MDIIGRWHGYASQAILGKTPLRVQKPGAIGDIVFEPNGKMFSEKPKKFGSGIKRYEYFYEYNSNSGQYKIYSEDYGQIKFWATLFIVDGELLWKYADDAPLGMGGSCLFFRKG